MTTRRLTAFLVATLVGAACVVGVQSATADAGTPGVTSTVTLVSGAGVPGGNDPGTMLQTVPGGPWRPATILSSPHYLYGVIAGTRWVSQSASGYGVAGSPVLYRATFELPDEYFAPSISVSFHADDTSEVLLNGTKFAGQAPGSNMSNFMDPPTTTGSAPDALFRPGLNVLDFRHTDYANPGGLDYKAVIRYNARLACRVDYAPAASAGPGTPTALAMTMRDEAGAPIAQRNLIIEAIGLRGHWSSIVTTGDDGAASATYELPPGVYDVAGRFDGDTLYRPCTSAYATLTVDREPTALAWTPDLVVAPGGDAVVTAQLSGVASSFNSLGGRAILATIVSATGDEVVQAMNTASDGTAAATLPLSPGVYSTSAAFAGDDDFLPSSSDTVEIVVRGATSLVAGDVVSVPSLLGATGRPALAVGATLTGEGSAFPNQPVEFAAGATALCSAVTNDAGYASCEVPSALVAVVTAQGFRAEFGGDRIWEPASANAALVSL